MTLLPDVRETDSRSSCPRKSEPAQYMDPHCGALRRPTDVRAGRVASVLHMAPADMAPTELFDVNGGAAERVCCIALKIHDAGFAEGGTL